MMQIRVRCKLSAFLLHLLLAGLSSPTIEAGNFLIPEQPLYDNGTTLISSGGSFELGFFSPAGSGRRYIGIWFRNISQTIVWVANRSSPIHNRSGRFWLSGEGMLVVASDNSTSIWSSITATRLANPEATLFDDGNFAVREAGNDDPDSFAWQSFDFPTDTLLPGMKLGWDLDSSVNRQLTSWASADDPSPGNYTLGINLQGDPQLFLRSGTQQLWRGGPWNGLQFSGAPGMDDPILFEGTFVVDPHRVIYSFGPRDPSTISVLVVGQKGIFQRLVWNGGTGAWDLNWYIPQNQCDMMPACGANALCDPYPTPKCTCLAGFLENSVLRWTPGNTQYGCSRRSPWNCGNGTDGFLRIARLKLPDTSTSVVDRRLNLSECRESCMSGCYCTAYASSNVGENASGCIMWVSDLADIRLYSDTQQGQDLYVRMGAFDLTDPTDGSSNRSFGRSQLALVIVVPALAAFLLLCCIACFFCRRRKRKNCVVVKEIEEKDLDLPLFDLDTILAATSNFAAENKLGQGGFGPVYKGKLVDGREIAVKRLSKTSTQGIHEFKNEVVIIAKLQHQNLVRLLGCCIQGGERMLIYEFMPNRSLDAALFDEAKPLLLDWKARYSIIVGIARGLLYLHHDSRLKIIHRDLKTSNILLDKDNIPKISDFGLARIFKGDEMEINTRRVVGTYGYMSPEYAMNGFFSIKSDVFSFGVLILEIVSGKKNREIYNSNYLNLSGHIWSLWKEDKSLQIIDESIGHSFSTLEVMRCIKIGLLCVQERPQDRPTMSLVVIMLGSDCPIPEPKQPGFVAALDSSDSAIREQYLLSINNVSNTTLEGR